MPETTKKHTTIKDIAKKLGISTSTVSRALSDSWEIKKETRELVLKAAAELNYHPNPMAIGLVTKRSHTIGLCVPELVHSFFPKIITGMQRTLSEAGYTILITTSDESYETERKNLLLLKQNLVDGILISTTSESHRNADLYNEILNSGTPIVFFNRVCSKIDAPKVVIDDTRMAYIAVKHLIEQGYEKIVHMAGPRDLDLTKLRLEGFLKAMKESGRTVDESSVIDTGMFIDDGAREMERLIKCGAKPDAVFAFNDPVAIGAMKAAKKLGLRIPQDTAFAGFSESKSALIVEPALTSVAQPLSQMGEVAAKCIIDKINGRDASNPAIVLDARLNIRDSSAIRCQNLMPTDM